jgi:urease accessory protein
VLINSAGGLTGGDRMSLAVRMEADTRALVTTQACEKIYRSTGAEAEIATVLSLGTGRGSTGSRRKPFSSTVRA